MGIKTPTSRVGFVSIAASISVLVFAGAIFAQWPSLPTPGAPKTADGKVNLTGPVPRTPDGKPDFSGVWAAVGGPDGNKLPAPVVDGSKAPKGDFKNMGKGGASRSLPYQPWALELYKKRLEQNSAGNPDSHCLPLNPVQLWFHPEPRKLIWSPREYIYTAEANSAFREIHMDGRPLPKAADVQPWWYGYSVGKWDGDTLVVDTAGFLDNAWIDENGSPLTNEAHVTEKIRRPNYGTLEIEITVDDPKTYTKPWTVLSQQVLRPGDELIEFVCENNTSLQHIVGK